MNKEDTFFIDFGSTMDISLKITEIHETKTAYGSQIFIRGTEINDNINVEFYCPHELLVFLTELKVREKDIIRIEYFGIRNVDGIKQTQFFVERCD